MPMSATPSTTAVRPVNGVLPPPVPVVPPPVVGPDGELEQATTIPNAATLTVIRSERVRRVVNGIALFTIVTYVVAFRHPGAQGL